MRAASLFVGGRVGRLTTPDRATLEPPPPDSPDWDLCARDTARQNAILARLAAALIMAFLVVVWPLDLLFLDRDAAQQAIFTHWRLSVLGVFSAMYLTLSYVPAAQRRPAVASAPFCAAACAALAYFIGLVGGLERPFFYMVWVLLIIPAAAPMNLPARLLFQCTLAAGLLSGFFGAHPEHARSPLLLEALFFIVTVLAATTAVGHVVYVGTCQRFFQGLSIERTARELESLNGTLDQRVRQKTAELARITEHLQVVQDEERARIARELHDELGQRLSALRFVLANARRRFERAPTTLAPNLAELDGMIDGALACTREIVSGLRPPLLEQLGLAPAIEWLAHRTSRQTGIACALDLQGDGACSPAVAVAAYRVLQESLTNVARHAGASRMSVRLRVSPERVELEVVDDGRGFPGEGAGPTADRNGLLGMRERAYALGGELRTDNAPEGGARVRLTLPAGVPAEVGA